MEGKSLGVVLKGDLKLDLRTESHATYLVLEGFGGDREDRVDTVDWLVAVIVVTLDNTIAHTLRMASEEHTVQVAEGSHSPIHR